MEVYLDNSATTRCYESVGDLVRKVMCEDYGNPSSMHKKGVEAEQYINHAKEIIAKQLKAQPKEIVFTSGGTESDNLALRGYAHANERRGKHLITSSVEHPAILNTMQQLEQEGFRVTYLPVDETGRVRLDALEEALDPETILVSIMYVNNEIGTVQPIEEAVRIVKGYNPSICFHSDAVQGFGKYRIYPARAGIDMLSVSGHKIHGPKGIGFLYLRDRIRISPILFGGGQQKNIRSGTENVPGIAGLGLATWEIYQNLDQKVSYMRELRERFLAGIADIGDIHVHGASDIFCAPHIVSVGFAGVRSEVLLHALEEAGIYVSAGSACASNHPQISGVLRAVGTKKTYLESTLRFSLSEFTTEDEILYTLEKLHALVPALRRYRRH